MAGAKLAVSLAGKLKNLLGVKGFAQMGGLPGVQQIAREGLVSGGYSAGMTALNQLMSGEGINIPEILAYGAADTLTGGLSVAGVRALRGNKGFKRTQIKDPKTGKITTVKELQRSNLEVPANIAASFITPMAVDSMLGKTQGAAQAQEQQVTAQQVQRALMNNDPNLLAGAYMPYTNFQAQGGPSGSAMMRQLANDMGTGTMNDPTFNANAMAIMGL